MTFCLDNLDEASANRRIAEAKLDNHTDACDLCSGQSVTNIMASRTCAKGRALAFAVRGSMKVEEHVIFNKPRGAVRRIKNNRS